MHFFRCDSLTSITIPSSVTSIGKYAFCCCDSFTSVTIPDSVTSIGYCAFNDCWDLTAINVDSNNEYYSSSNGVLFNKDKTELIQYPTMGKTYYTIPDTVVTIADCAFGYCTKLKSVIISNSVTTIGNFAFAMCNLSRLDIPDSVTSIGSGAFDYCSSIRYVIIGSGLKSIGEAAFEWCDYIEDVYYAGTYDEWNSINIEDGNEYLTNASWHYGQAEHETGHQFTYGDYVYTIYDDDNAEITRYYGSEANVVIPDEIDGVTITSIGDWAFADNDDLTNVTIPDGVKAIGDSAFSACFYLQSVTIPGSVTTIGESAFSCCEALENVVIRNGVTTIGAKAFNYCDVLSCIEIPVSVTTIGEQAFIGCYDLEDVNYSGTEEQWEAISIGSNNDPLINADIHYNNHYKYQFSDDDYDYKIVNNEYAEIIGYHGNDSTVVIPSQINGTPITKITNTPKEDYAPGDTSCTGAFEGCTATSIIVPDTVEEIGMYCFSSCPNLTNLQLSNNLVSIDYCGVYNCKKLKSLIVPKSVTKLKEWSIGYNTPWWIPEKADDFVIMCYKDSAAEEYAINNEFDYVLIDEEYDYRGLHYRILADGTVEATKCIEKGQTFSYVTDISGMVIIPSEIKDRALTSIGKYAFSGTSYNRVEIPDSVTNISEGAFSNCENLNTITIPATVTTIGDNAFGYDEQDGEYVKRHGFRILCYSGSAAEEYAIENGFSYGLLDGNNLPPEDMYDITEKDDGTAEITAYYGTESNLTIPSEIAGLQVTSIADDTFMNLRPLVAVTVPEGVTSIGDYAFNGCTNLKTVNLPETLESIGADAFTGSERLRNITIPKAVTSIGDNAFEHQYIYGSEVFIMRDFVINCYAVTEGYNYATENGYVYNVIPTGELKYQLRANDDGSTDVRFILIADEQEVLAADSASVYATIDGTDTDAIIINRAYRSLKAGGKTITADEGKVFLIGKIVNIPEDLINGMAAHFTLGENTYNRTIAS